MTKERVSLFLQYLQQLVTEDRRFYGRQISEAGCLREVGHGSRRLQIGERLVDGGDERRIAGEADITPINADRIIITGCGEPGIGMGGAVASNLLRSSKVASNSPPLSAPSKSCRPGTRCVMWSIKLPFSNVIRIASPSVPLSIAMRSPARSPTPEILRPRAFSPSTTVSGE